MNKILLIAHAPLASALHICALHLFIEKQNQIFYFDVPSDQDSSLLYQQAQSIVEENTVTGDNWLIVSDVYGATPGNITKQLVSNLKAIGCYGINVPMLWSLLFHIDEDVSFLVTLLEQVADQSIKLVTAIAPTATPAA